MSPAALFTLAAAAVTAPALATTSDAVLGAVRFRAEAANFEGTILVGEKNGSSRMLVLGPQPAAPDAVWRWASITKQLAAVIAMQEVAKGRLDLDAPVARYWPRWKSPSAGSIRIRDLMLHNSGLPQPDESTPDGDGIPAFYRKSAVAPSQSADGFCAGAPRAAAPAKFEYNNCDTIVLAEVLARITGKPFRTLARERLARPLGMKRFGIFAPGRPLRNVAPDGEFANLDGMLELGAYGASGGAYGTIEDLWRFDRALLSGQLLPAPEREAMWQSSRSNGFYGFQQWIFPAKLSGCAGETQVVERQGQIGGIEHRNYLLPATGQAVIFFGRHRPSGYGDPWEGKGFAYDVLSAVACRP